MNSWQEQIAEVKAQLASIEESLAFLVAAKRLEEDQRAQPFEWPSPDADRRQEALARKARRRGAA